MSIPPNDAERYPNCDAYAIQLIKNFETDSSHDLVVEARFLAERESIKAGRRLPVTDKQVLVVMERFRMQKMLARFWRLLAVIGGLYLGYLVPEIAQGKQIAAGSVILGLISMGGIVWGVFVD